MILSFLRHERERERIIERTIERVFCNRFESYNVSGPFEKVGNDEKRSHNVQER